MTPLQLSLAVGWQEVYHEDEQIGENDGQYSSTPYILTLDKVGEEERLFLKNDMPMGVKIC